MDSAFHILCPTEKADANKNEKIALLFRIGVLSKTATPLALSEDAYDLNGKKI